MKRKIRKILIAIAERLGPQLWRFNQYTPRPIYIPPSYKTPTATPGPAPQIAIVTPSYNQGEYLGATIDSVLDQSYPRLNYRVEDGGSTDRSCTILKSYGTRLAWQSESDSGQASAINRGFSRISGDIMGYLNSDDLLLPGALSYVARAFFENPEIDFVYGHRVYINADGSEIGRWITVTPHDPEIEKWVNIVPQETMFWRKRVWDAIGPFNENFRFALDWDFILRAQSAGFKFKRLPRFLGCFRMHNRQKTSTMWDVNEVEAALLKESYLGFNPDNACTDRTLRSFYIKQILLQRLYNLGFIRY